MIRLLRRLPLSVVGAVLGLPFFFLYYLYLWLVVDLRLIYHSGGIVLDFPVFYLGWEFFRQSVSRPGGLVEYVSAFLAHFFYIGWAGALIATAQAWLLWLCSGAVVRVASGRRLNWVGFVATIILLVLYARYVYLFGIAMNGLVAFGFAYLYLVTASKRKPTDLLIFLVLLIILYAIAGGACLLFAVLCGICEVFLRRRPLLGIIFLGLTPIVTRVVSLAVFNVGVIDAFNDFIPSFSTGGIINAPRFVASCAFYLLLPLTLVGLWLVEILRKNHVAPPDAAGKEEQNPPGRFTVWFTKETAPAVTPLLAIVAGALIATFCQAFFLKAIISVDYYACNKMWPEVLEASAPYQNNKFINHTVNRALYHTGRLADDMFVYPQ
ncbi:MAG: DUF6057 family protein, partial [Sedimentisphaerales bacterium]